jgi:hypothetical protein
MTTLPAISPDDGRLAVEDDDAACRSRRTMTLPAILPATAIDRDPIAFHFLSRDPMAFLFSF